jgi:ribosome recycling factor
MDERADLLLIDLEERMDKTIVALIRDLASIRTGRANPSLLDKLLVPYYGTLTPIKQVASVIVIDGGQLQIKPFDKNMLKEVEKAINSSTLGLTPLNDGIVIRLVIPQPTEQKRRELIKEVEHIGESAKVAIRNIRREFNEQTKKLELTEDDEKGYLIDIQTSTDKFIKSVDEEILRKSNELLKI